MKLRNRVSNMKLTLWKVLLGLTSSPRCHLVLLLVCKMHPPNLSHSEQTYSFNHSLNLSSLTWERQLFSTVSLRGWGWLLPCSGHLPEPQSFVYFLQWHKLSELCKTYMNIRSGHGIYYFHPYSTGTQFMNYSQGPIKLQGWLGSGV